jgi:hypothetical protein
MRMHLLSLFWSMPTYQSNMTFLIWSPDPIPWTRMPKALLHSMLVLYTRNTPTCSRYKYAFSTNILHEDDVMSLGILFSTHNIRWIDSSRNPIDRHLSRPLCQCDRAARWTHWLNLVKEFASHVLGINTLVTLPSTSTYTYTIRMRLRISYLYRHPILHLFRVTRSSFSAQIVFLRFSLVRLVILLQTNGAAFFSLPWIPFCLHIFRHSVWKFQFLLLCLYSQAAYGERHGRVCFNFDFFLNQGDQCWSMLGNEPK